MSIEGSRKREAFPQGGMRERAGARPSKDILNGPFLYL